MPEKDYTSIKKVLNTNSKNKTFYWEEIKTAYDIAIKNAVEQRRIRDSSLGSVCEKIWGNESYDEETLRKMRLGFCTPNWDLLTFIKDFAGDKYDYTFLAPDYGKSLISKFNIYTDGEHTGYLCSKNGEAFSASETNNASMCALFLVFVEMKKQEEIDDDTLFYDYLLYEKQNRISCDPLFYNYPQDLKISVIQNIEMVNILPYEVWYIVRSLPVDEKTGTAIALWEIIDKITPDLAKLSAQSKDAQYFIHTQKCLISENDKKPKPTDLEISQEYQLDFLHSIPTLNPNEWDRIIKLVALQDLFPELYEKVIALTIEVLNIQLMNLQQKSSLNN